MGDARIIAFFFWRSVTWHIGVFFFFVFYPFLHVGDVTIIRRASARFLSHPHLQYPQLDASRRNE